MKHRMTQRMAEVTALIDIINNNSKEGNDSVDKILSICMECESVIDKQTHKPIYLTEYQKGYLMALTIADYGHKKKHIGLSHGYDIRCAAYIKGILERDK
jgi:hypothetical protein